MIKPILHTSAREATRSAAAELSARYGETMPPAIIADVLSGTSIQLPRNADGLVSVWAYAEWHNSLGEEVTRELQAQSCREDYYYKTASDEAAKR